MITTRQGKPCQPKESAPAKKTNEASAVTSATLALGGTNQGSSSVTTPPPDAKEAGNIKRGDLARYSDSVNHFAISSEKKGETAPDQQLSLGGTSSSADTFDEKILE